MTNQAVTLAEALLEGRPVLTKDFVEDMKRLHPDDLARAADLFNRWQKDPQTLNFEPKHHDIFGVEITHNVHVLVRRTGGDIIMLFIGYYKEYNAYGDKLRKDQFRETRQPLPTRRDNLVGAENKRRKAKGLPPMTKAQEDAWYAKALPAYKEKRKKERQAA